MMCKREFTRTVLKGHRDYSALFLTAVILSGASHAEPKAPAPDDIPEHCINMKMIEQARDSDLALTDTRGVLLAVFEKHSARYTAILPDETRICAKGYEADAYGQEAYGSIGRFWPDGKPELAEWKVNLNARMLGVDLPTEASKSEAAGDEAEDAQSEVVKDLRKASLTVAHEPRHIEQRMMGIHAYIEANISPQERAVLKWFTEADARLQTILAAYTSVDPADLEKLREHDTYVEMIEAFENTFDPALNNFAQAGAASILALPTNQALFEAEVRKSISGAKKRGLSYTPEFDLQTGEQANTWSVLDDPVLMGEIGVMIDRDGNILGTYTSEQGFIEALKASVDDADLEYAAHQLNSTSSLQIESAAPPENALR